MANSADLLGASPPRRALALPAAIVLMLALALIALNFLIHWSPRAGGAPSAEGAEARLYNLLEPVAGEGQLRLSLTRRADGGQTLLVLLDRASPADRRVIADLASASGLISLEAGDTVTLKDIEFAPGFAARLSPLEMAEAGCLVLLIGASGMLLMRTLMLPHTVGQTVSPRTDLAGSPPAPASPAEKPRPRLVAQPPAIEAAQKNPAQSARIVRDWMAGRGGAE